ncbi:MAG: hypothetical protein QS721_08740 [Candidatus Endonucleobacter sp. (ex Gigantidas childressi)]|nr:hypothetical protein [Candidatus Endonucleobacter sp. (ex Gigantidas childressi)]
MKKAIKEVVYKILTKSLALSNASRHEEDLKIKLSKIVPDLTHQYTTFRTDMTNQYLVNKVRGVHSFQVSIALKAVELLTIGREDKNMDVNIVDIGDSSGTHLIYLKVC